MPKRAKFPHGDEDESAANEPIVSAPELSLFSRRNTEVSILGKYDMEVPCMQAIRDNDPITFEIPADNTTLTHPEIYLKVLLKVTNGDGTELKNNDAVALSTNALSTLFSDILVTCNGVITNSADGLYSYQAYIQNVFMTPADEQNVMDGTDALFRSDPAELGISADTNLGFKSRRLRIAKSHVACLIGKIRHPLFNQDKYLLPSMGFRITCHQSPVKHRLMGSATSDYKVNIMNAHILYEKVIVHDLYMVSLLKTLQHSPVVYDVLRPSLRQYEISSSLTIYNTRLETNTRLPSLVCAFMIPTANLNSYNNDPHRADIREISRFHLAHDNTSIPTVPYSTIDQEGQATMFHSLQKEIKRVYGHWPCVSFKEFVEGYGLAVFPVDKSSASAKSLPKTGSLQLSVHFSKVTTLPMTLIVASYYNSTVYVDSAANVILDYTP